ncbi:MAG: hypothetical protein RL189_356 [Pseudomonadota bacterium]|jgi:UDP-N-acetylmuramoyl-tripeptide--D-alanyl-D-alanine ligase
MWPKKLNEIAQILGVPSPSSKTVASDTQAVMHSLCTDSRKLARGELFVAIKGDTHDGHRFVESTLQQGAVAAIVEKSWLDAHPQLSEFCLAVDDTTQALRTLGKAFRSEFTFPLIAVGGSNGKTTTKEMLASLLGGAGMRITRTHKSENGFLGLAVTLTQTAHNKSHPPKALVAEIGIDDVGAMSEHVAIATPDFALLTALGPEHLAGLGTWDKAVEEELLLFRNSPKNCRRIWQLCEPRLAEVADEVRAGDAVVIDLRSKILLPASVGQLMSEQKIAVLEFEVSEQKATYSMIKTIWRSAGKNGQSDRWETVFKVPLPGIHNAQNFALALATAAHTGCRKNELEQAWTSFTPPEMRSRIVNLNRGITLYDDCYNASPASMDAAFDALLSDEWKGRHKVVILGDMLDLGGESKSWHLKLIAKLLKIENSDLCLFGTAMYDVYNEIKTNYSRELQNGNIRLRHAGADVDPARFVDELNGKIAGAVVLVKGSRGMDLGRFVKSCEAWSAAQG